MHQTSGKCAGMCTSDCMHQMDKTGATIDFFLHCHNFLSIKKIKIKTPRGIPLLLKLNKESFYLLIVLLFRSKIYIL